MRKMRCLSNVEGARREALKRSRGNRGVIYWLNQPKAFPLILCLRLAFDNSWRRNVGLLWLQYSQKS